MKSENHKKFIEKGLLTEEESDRLIDKRHIEEIEKAMAEDNEVDMMPDRPLTMEEKKEFDRKVDAINGW